MKQVLDRFRGEWSFSPAFALLGVATTPAYKEAWHLLRPK